jgi:16S rRNA (cytosine1402-N4)-methyltransferase
MDVAASIQHHAVMQQELLDWLLPPRSDAVIVDCTLGGGGHSREFLQATPGPRWVIGLDRDPACIAAAQEWGTPWGSRFMPVHGDFRDLSLHLERLNCPRVDAILLDLGVSSYQLDTAARGFSFRRDGPLDMRMDPTQSDTACSLVNRAPESDLRTIFKTLGEERWAARIARVVVAERRQAPITRTLALAELVARSIPRSAWPRDIHPATRVFQALRMAVNGELEALQSVLPQAVAALRPGGRLGVLAFHSLEDRQVKRFMQQEAKGCVCPPRLPQCMCGRQPQLTVLTRKPQLPTAHEVQANPRSRSARLRVGEKRVVKE